MKILFYGNREDKEQTMQHIQSQVCMIYRQITSIQTEDYEDYIHALESDRIDLVIVAADNAAGMEGVVAVKNTKPQIPVLWFSNDKNFVAQSYRLGVTYFGIKPIEERTIKLALERCWV